MNTYDIAVIGGGPGGYVAAIRAGQSGKRVCLIEKCELGGVCLNEGCIPTKAFLKTVSVLLTVRNAEAFAVTGTKDGNFTVDMNQLQKVKSNRVKKLTSGVGALLKANGVTVYKGEGSFQDKNNIIIGNEKIFAEHVIIATGSEPVMPSIVMGNGTPKVITSREALDLTKIPSKIVIVGGGVVGIEFAYFFAHMGSEVTIVEMMDQILPMVDDEIALSVSKSLQKEGVKIQTSAKVTKLENGKAYYSLESKEISADAEIVLMSVGRRPVTKGFGLEKLGVQMNGGAIYTDEFMQTSVAGVYAIGDVNGKCMLAHTASMEGIIAVEHILGGKRSMKYEHIPSCIYIQPEIAAVGLTEKQARELYGNINVGRFPLSANGKAIVEGEETGLVKVITEAKYGEILGVHIYGIHATDMIAEIVLAMELEATAEDIAETIHPHPTVSEIIPEAFHAALGRAIHYVNSK